MEPDVPNAYSSPARDIDPDEARELFQRVLDLHGPRLSHATIGVTLGDWLGRAELPPDARQAATELERLAAGNRPGAPWYRRSLPAGTIRLDLHDPSQLDLLRRYGPFSTDTTVWVEDNPDPAVETADALNGQPRVTYRLTADELDHLGPCWPRPAWTIPAWCPSAREPARRAAERATADRPRSGTVQQRHPVWSPLALGPAPRPDESLPATVDTRNRGT
jgi:hypothetical protein